MPARRQKVVGVFMVSIWTLMDSVVHWCTYVVRVAATGTNSTVRIRKWVCDVQMTVGQLEE